MNNKLLKDIFNKASFCRHFENKVFQNVQDKKINIPVYISAGQEFISAAISSKCEQLNIKPNLFIQHRGHSTYLSFGGDPVKLIDELLGLESGCTKGKGGSASIHSKEINLFGHDGLMGSQIPIAVGHCYETRKPTIVFSGDAAAEEDYALAAYGWASTKNLPILFVIEDNNLSILTEKKVRRNWEINDVATGFKLDAKSLSDDPIEIISSLDDIFKKPLLLNINTNRKYWHSGAGIDDENNFDRYEYLLKQNPEYVSIDHQNKSKVDNLWEKQLEKL